MHVVSLALDPKTLDPESVVAFRNRAYGRLTEHYSIVVPSPATMVVHLSDKTTVYGVGGFHKVVQLISMYRRARALIRAGKCDVITSQDMYFLGLLGLFLARRYHLGLEVQVLGIEKLTPFRKRIALFVLHRAGVVRALSDRLKDRLITEFNVPEKLINVVTIYVDVQKLGLDVRSLKGKDTEEFERLTRAFREQYGSRMNFLSVSRLVPIKRIELQLEAIAALKQRFPQVMLHIVGDGPDEVRIKTLVSNLGLEKEVLFHGYQTGYALGMFYIECDCFLLTSDYEGWGMVIIEAATAGLPIIMTDVGCAREFIRDEKSGLVIPPQDGQALIGAMERVITDPELRQKLSVGAIQALAQLPSFDTILMRYKENWEVALSRRM